MIAFILDHLKRAFTVVTSPYYQSKQVICATTLEGEELASRPSDIFVLEDYKTKLDFFECVKKSFESPIMLNVRSLETEKGYLMTVLNGVCTLHYTIDIKFTVQYRFEKGVKLNDSIVLRYDAISNSYIVRTTDFVRREVRYVHKQPKGESYDRVLTCLSSRGPMTTAEIAKALGLTENRISGRVSEMRKCGLVCKNGTKSVDGRTQTIWALPKRTATRNYRNL